MTSIFRSMSKLGFKHSPITSQKVFYTSAGALLFYGIIGLDATWVAYNGLYYGLYGPDMHWTHDHSEKKGMYGVPLTPQESLEFGLPMPWQRRRYEVGADPEEFAGLAQQDDDAKIAGWGNPDYQPST